MGTGKRVIKHTHEWKLRIRYLIWSYTITETSIINYWTMRLALYHWDSLKCLTKNISIETSKWKAIFQRESNYAF